MTGLSPIDRHIASTRLNCPDRVDEDLYLAIRKGTAFDRFVELFKLDFKFKVVYSPARKVERITIAGENWLVYDQYLGQTMNMLNRIFFEASDEEDAIVYFHKYFAERTLEYGCPMLGVHFANFYDNQRRETAKRPPSISARTLFTMLNERFNIGHELAHELIDADHSYLRHMMDSATELLRERRESHGRQTAESLLGGYPAAIPEVHFGKDFETFKADTLEWFEGEVGRAWDAEYVQATHQGETRVELFCDLVAVDFALEPFFDRDTGMEDAIRALYVGAYHMRTIRYFDWHCAEILLHRTHKDDLAVRNGRALAAMSVRNHCFRDHLLFVYHAHLHDVGADDVDERTEALLHLLLKDQNRYYERILDPAAKLLSFFSEEGRLQEYADAISARVPDLDKIELLDVSASLAIAQQTGWPFSLVEHLFEDVIS